MVVPRPALVVRSWYKKAVPGECCHVKEARPMKIDVEAIARAGQNRAHEMDPYGRWAWSRLYEDSRRVLISASRVGLAELARQARTSDAVRRGLGDAYVFVSELDAAAREPDAELEVATRELREAEERVASARARVERAQGR